MVFHFFLKYMDLFCSLSFAHAWLCVHFFYFRSSLYCDSLLVLLLQHYEGDIKELCLDFTVTEESFGKHRVIELKPGGKDTSVANENKMQYVHAMADYKLNRQVSN